MAGDTLRDRDVLRVDRQHLRAGAPRQLEHERPAGDEHLLVRQRDVAAELERGHDGREARAAHQRPDHQLGVGSGDLDQALRARDHAQLGIAHGLAHARGVVGARHAAELGPELLALLHQQIDRAAGGERNDGQPVREAGDHVEGLRADRAGRAEQRQPLHVPVSRFCALVRPKRRSRCWKAQSASTSLVLVKSGQSASLVKNSV